MRAGHNRDKSTIRGGRWVLRDLGTIEAELRLILGKRSDGGQRGSDDSGDRIDELLDEWLCSYHCLMAYGVRLWPD